MEARRGETLIKLKKKNSFLKFATNSFFSQKLSLEMTFRCRLGASHLVSRLEAFKNVKICTQNCKQGKT